MCVCVCFLKCFKFHFINTGCFVVGCGQPWCSDGIAPCSASEGIVLNETVTYSIQYVSPVLFNNSHRTRISPDLGSARPRKHCLHAVHMDLVPFRLSVCLTTPESCMGAVNTCCTPSWSPHEIKYRQYSVIDTWPLEGVAYF